MARVTTGKNKVNVRYNVMPQIFFIPIVHGRVEYVFTTTQQVKKFVFLTKICVKF